MIGRASVAVCHAAQTGADRAICEALRIRSDDALPEADSRIWHDHPVWFLEENPIVGYSN